MATAAKSIFVTKAHGQKEPFSFEKVYQSALSAGASVPVAQDIAEIIQSKVRPGMSTWEIFKRIKDLLTSRSPQTAIRFSLKEGIRKLGPSGYPFEKYIQAIFAKNSFVTEASQEIPGGCTHYEIDFLAYLQSKPAAGFPFNYRNSLFVGECKYHCQPGTRVDLDVALAHYALFLDIQKGPLAKRPKLKSLTFRPILVTNTKFTDQAVEYGTCAGLDLWGWRYPPGQGLERLIDKQKLYPITILPSAKKELAELLINHQIVLLEDLLRADPQKMARELGLSPYQVSKLMEEAKLLNQ